MIYNDFTKQETTECFRNIDKYLQKKDVSFIKYLDLGCKVIRVISYSEKFLPHIEKQLTFILRDTAPRYDETLVVWQEEDFKNFLNCLSDKFNPAKNIKLRLDYLMRGKKPFDVRVMDKEFSLIKPVIEYNIHREIFSAYDKDHNTSYCGVKDLSPEEYIKDGHLFVQFINEILKTDSSNLVHGAAIGLNGNGILFCARGQRGKSTLSVLSMMRGFEYVSDDYLTIYKKNGQLMSAPIYSIITLSPEMYGRLYKDMSNSQFVSNNARKDKYVFNISNFHPLFRMDYPIKLAIFPEIVTDKEPSIRLCTKEEKGRAITHLIQSTLSQVRDLCDEKTIQKIYSMVKDLPFYKFNLCHNIERNTEFLREFMNNWDKQDKTVIDTDSVFIDITFDLANIIDINAGTVYTMNKFATNIFENLLNGVSVNDMREQLKLYSEYNENILKEYDLLIKFINDKNIEIKNRHSEIVLNKEFINQDNFRIIMTEFSHELGANNMFEIKEKEDDKLQIK